MNAIQTIAVAMATSALLSVAGAPATASAQAASSPTAPDWASLGKLPDWTGVWLPDQEDQYAQMKTNPPPWTAKVAAQVEAQGQAEKAGDPKGIFTDCLPEAMPSWMLVSHNAMEFAFAPGLVFMLGESDSNRLRRVYTDGRKHPADADETFHGHSIGRWEGDTLVIDTVAIKPQTWIAISEAQGIPNNGGMHIVERMRLVEPNVLHDELTITAPQVLTKPWTTTRIFRREPGPQPEIVEGVCLEGSFKAAKDAEGNAIFVPVERTPGGNRASAQ